MAHRFDLVRNLHKVVSNSFTTFENTASFPLCNEYDRTKLTENRDLHNLEVNYNDMCYIYPVSANISDVTAMKHATSHLLDGFIRNHKEGGQSQWQVFGMANGLAYIYPATWLDETEITSLDMRLRPWYVASATIEKDLVIAIDLSSGMMPHFTIAKTLAQLILLSTQPNDNVVVFGFSGGGIAETDIAPCLATKLMPASSFFKRELALFIDNLTTIENTNTSYAEGLQRLSRYLSYNDSRSRLTKVVVFISGPVPTETVSDVTTLIEAVIPGKVKMMTFNLENSGEQNDVLEAMSAKSGAHTAIDHRRALPEQVKELFQYLKNSPTADPVITAPYYGMHNQGSKLTASMPVIVNQRLVGVVSVDIDLNKPMRRSAQLDGDDYSYYFLIAMNGDTYYHPTMPGPSDPDEPPVVVSIGILEKEALAAGILASMMRGESGERNLMTQRTVFRGPVKKIPYKSMAVNSKFIWQPVKGTMFSVCLVLGESLNNLTMQIVQSIPLKRFINANIWEDIQLAKCVHYSRVVTKVGASVHFNERAFLDPALFHITDQAMKEYHQEMVGVSPKPIFRDNVKESLKLASLVDPSWIDPLGEEPNIAIWRFLATRNGVTRWYPGVSGSHTVLTPQLREWYMHAVGDADMIILSPPHVDGFGSSTIIVTISKALTTRVDGKDIFGVLAAAVPFEYIFIQVQSIYSQCAQTSYTCFLVDEEGYIIAHDDFIIPPRNKNIIPAIRDIHITKKEPKIAATLIDVHAMTQISCIHPVTQMEVFSYQMRKNIHISKHDDIARREGFEIYDITQTNVYIVIKYMEQKYRSDLEIYCQCSDWHSKTIPECKKVKQTSCECPCHKYASSLVCGEVASKETRLCSPVGPTPEYEDLSAGEVAVRKLLDPCYQLNCESKETFMLCHAHAGCRWCSVGEDGANLGDESFCADVRVCHFGMVGHHGLHGDVVSRRSPDSTWLYIRLLALAVLLVGLVCLGVVAYRHGVFEQLMAESPNDDIRSMGRISEKQPSLKSWMRNAAPDVSRSQARRQTLPRDVIQRVRSTSDSRKFVNGKPRRFNTTSSSRKIIDDALRQRRGMKGKRPSTDYDLYGSHRTSSRNLQRRESFSDDDIYTMGAPDEDEQGTKPRSARSRRSSLHSRYSRVSRHSRRSARSVRIMEKHSLVKFDPKSPAMQARFSLDALAKETLPKLDDSSPDTTSDSPPDPPPNSPEDTQP